MKDLWASIVIAAQNFEAKFGTLVYILFFGFIFILLLVSVIKTVAAGRRTGRKIELREKKADVLLKKRAAESLSEMIKFRTVSGEYEQMQGLFDFMRKNYQGAFSKLKLSVLEDGIILCFKGADPSKKPALLCGHLDVVPEGDGWEHDAFAGERADGKIYGRGACDCKGPVSAIFEAIEQLIKQEKRPERDVFIALGLDEETRGNGAENIAKWFREKGITFDLILDEGGYIAKSHMGSGDYPIALIGIGERETCYFRIKSSASGGHSSLPGEVTAVGVLSEAICRIETAGGRFKLTPFAEKFLKNSMPAMSFKKRFVTANLPYTTFMLKWAFKNDPEASSMLTSSLVPTQVTGSAAPNMLSSTAEGVISAQLLPGESAGDVHKYLKSLLSDLPVEVAMQEEGESLQLTSTEDPMYKLICETVRERYDGVPCIAYLANGCSDAKHYADLSNCIVRFSPIVMEKVTAFSAHGPNERISEESLAEAVEVYMRLITKL